MNSFFTMLIIIQALIGAALVGIILIQKSEGGGLGTGGSPSGFMSARGAADFLTRTTAILATLFVALAIVLAALAVKMGAPQSVDASLNRTVAPVAQPAPAAPAVSPTPAPTASSAPADPLAGILKK